MELFGKERDSFFFFFNIIEYFDKFISASLYCLRFVILVVVMATKIK